MQPAVNRAAADLRQVSVPRDAMILAPVQVALAAVTARHRVTGPAGQQLVHFRPAVQIPQAAAPGSAGGHGGELVHNPAQDREQFVPAQADGE